MEDVHTKILVDQAVSRAKQVAVEKGTSFLSGNDTTAFSNLGPNAVQFSAEVAGAGALTYKIAEGIKNGEVQAMVSSMASQAVSEIGARIGKLIGEYTGKATSLVASIPSKIADETARRVTKPNVPREKPIMSLSEIAEIVNGPDSVDKAKEEKYNNERKSDKIKKAYRIISTAVNKANKFMENANNRIKYIEKYALEGPEWIANQMSDVIDDAELEVRKELDHEFEYLEGAVNSWAKEEGVMLGDRIVAKTNKELKELAMKIRNQNEEAITQGKIKAKSVLQKAKLFIMGQLGINISVPVSTD